MYVCICECLFVILTKLWSLTRPNNFNSWSDIRRRIKKSEGYNSSQDSLTKHFVDPTKEQGIIMNKSLSTGYQQWKQWRWYRVQNNNIEDNFLLKLKIFICLVQTVETYEWFQTLRLLEKAENIQKENS